MRNALSVIQMDIRINTQQKDPDADITETLRCANARMVGLSMFLLDNFTDLAQRANNAFNIGKTPVARAYVEQMVTEINRIKKSAENHDYLN